MIGVGSALISLFLVLVCYSLTLTAKRADENLLMICEQNQKIEEEKGKQEMESKRDILRVIEKEIKKGSAPVAFAGLGFSEECYHLVDSQAKMNQLLDYFFRNEEYAALAERQVKSNIYAEMGKRLNFRSARSDRDRKNMEVAAKRWIKKKHPTYKVSIFEKNNKLLRKIYATGNGRCNFANQGNLKNKYNHEGFVLPIIESFSSFEITQYFERIGIKYKAVNDLLYPLSDTAETVALMLNKKVDQLKIEVHLEESMIDYSSSSLTTSKKTYPFDYLIIASGGKASPQYGSDGNIFSILKKHGYSLIDPKPSLCPIKVKENVNLVEGLRAKVRINLLIDGKLKHQEDGELLFKKDGLSGIAIFNLTHFINMENTQKRIRISSTANVESKTKLTPFPLKCPLNLFKLLPIGKKCPKYISSFPSFTFKY